MWFIVLAIIAIIALVILLDTVKPKNFPPGPKWVPIVGSALEIYNSRKKTGYLYKTVNDLTRLYCKDRSCLGLRIGKDRIVMVNTLEANKEMLYNEDLDGRPMGIFYQTRTFDERKGVLLTDGELWKEQRKFLLKNLKEFGFGRKGMGEIAKTEAEYMIKDITDMIEQNESGTVTYYMHNFFNTYILNVLWMMIAGLRYNPTDSEMLIMQNMLFELFAAVDMVGCLFSHFPVLSVIAPKLSGYRSFVRTHQRIWKFLREELEIHKQEFDSEKEDRDILDVYIRVLKYLGERDSYSEKQLVAMCMDMFMAGTETTSKSMSFCFSYLVRQQEVQKRAQAEIDEVVGKGRVPCFEDRPNMPYNEAVVHECIRHFMGRAFAVPHRALRKTTLAGYTIPENTMVVSNFTNILMDEKFYPEPYMFKPERFITDGKVVIPDHYFPFGLAKHRCLGDVLAKCNIFVFTTTMLQKFSFLPVPGEPLPSLDHIDGATPSAAPFKALIVPRT